MIVCQAQPVGAAAQYLNYTLRTELYMHAAQRHLGSEHRTNTGLDSTMVFQSVVISHPSRSRMDILTWELGDREVFVLFIHTIVKKIYYSKFFFAGIQNLSRHVKPLVTHHSLIGSLVERLCLPSRETWPPNEHRLRVLRHVPSRQVGFRSLQVSEQCLSPDDRVVLPWPRMITVVHLNVLLQYIMKRNSS